MASAPAHTAPKGRKSASVAGSPAASPESFEGLYRRGIAHLEAHEYAEAIQRFEAALADNPPPERQAAILFGLANAARRVGHPRTAEAYYGRVLTIDPERVEALVSLANLHCSTGRLRDAQSLLNDALKGNPEVPELWLALGDVLREAGDASSSEKSFNEALRLKPGFAAALASLGDLLVERGDAEAALHSYNAALRKDPGNAHIRLNRARLLLSDGALDDGWRDYAYRHKAAVPPLRVTHGLPAWSGDAIADGTLLISAEPALEDQLIFAGCLNDALEGAHASRAFIECAPGLVTLFTRSFPGARIHARNARDEAGLRVIDYGWLAEVGGATQAIAMGDLPARLYAGVPAQRRALGSLHPDPKQAAAWGHWIAGLPEGPVIGLCWRPGAAAEPFAPLSAWAEFLRETPGIFVSLQGDATREELATLTTTSSRPLHIPPGLDQKNDLDGVAALLSGLDTVIATPSIAAALSAAVGTPTLKILFNRSWTALGRDYEPLSPACRLMRPDIPGDWASAFAKTRRALASDPWVQLEIDGA